MSPPEDVEPLETARIRGTRRAPLLCMKIRGSACGKTRYCAETACRVSTEWSSSKTERSESCRSITMDRYGWSANIVIPSRPYSWEIPEGGSPASESAEATAIRELREETGLTAGRIELVMTTHLSNSVSDELGYLFRATELTHGGLDPEGTERITVRRFEWDLAWQCLKR